jgi:hypothetical protein
LTTGSKPLTYGEIAEEAKRYGDYRRNFGREQASNPLIRFVVVPNWDRVDLSRLEDFYELDEGEVVGNHTIYRARLK